MVKFREVLFNKNFFCLWLGQIVSEFGDRLNQMALISLVYSKYPGSAFAMANLLFFIVVPVFIIGPFAGVYVDRWDRKKVMIIADITRAILVLMIPICVVFNFIFPVYILVFFIFSASRFFIPSKLAFIPSLVSQEKLMVANTLSNTTRMIATILGFAAAGFIVNLVGHMWGFYLDGMSYIVSAVLIAVITPKKELKKVKEDLHITGEIIEKAIRKNVWQEITEGFKQMVMRNKMRLVTSIMFLIMAGAGSIFCIMIVFVQKAFGSVTKVLGVFGVFIGVGLFIGTVIFGKAGQKWSKVKTMFFCFILSGLFIALFSIYSSDDPVFMISGALLMCLGIVVAPIFTCTQTLIHLLVPDEVRGRIFSSMEAVMHLAFLVMMFLTAILAKYVSNLTILLSCALVFAFLGLCGVIFYKETAVKISSLHS